MTQKFGALLALLIIGATTQARAQEPFWKRLGDTTLERLVGEVVKSNHDVLAARARLRGARASRLQAALDFAPTVTASASYTRQRLAAAAFPGGFGTAFPAQNVWDAGLQVARRNAENQQHTLDVTLQRLEAGRGNEFDSERARAQLNSTLAAVPELEASIDAVEHRIAVLVGRPATGLEQENAAPTPFPELPDSVIVPNPDAVVRLRPDVRSAERQLAAGNALVGAAKAAYLPRIALGGGLGYVSSSFDALGNANTPRYAVGPVISWPALNLGRVKAGVDLARAQEAEADAFYRK